MAKQLIQLEIPATDATQAAEVKKALEVIVKHLSAKELNRLRQIILFEPSVLSAARQALNL
ncbi:MAG: hypothetical protein MUC87_20855 [Bacteroidia bacterium]|jgi:hypothetical protein|nr:hypothetical protein [Bacteroidia bacterium]